MNTILTLIKNPLSSAQALTEVQRPKPQRTEQATEQYETILGMVLYHVKVIRHNTQYKYNKGTNEINKYKCAIIKTKQIQNISLLLQQELTPLFIRREGLAKRTEVRRCL